MFIISYVIAATFEIDENSDLRDVGEVVEEALDSLREQGTADILSIRSSTSGDDSNVKQELGKIVGV